MSFLSTLFGSTKPASGNITILDAQAYAKAIENGGVQLVDVRTPNEYKGGHIKKAVNIDFFNGAKFEKAFASLDKNKPVYLYCRSGARSQKAARKIAQMGFTEIYDLRGGYMRWSA
jgi:rhodanese-related sulfurtransferase